MDRWNGNQRMLSPRASSPLCLTAVIWLLLAGCGHRPTAEARHMPSGYQSMSEQPFESGKARFAPPCDTLFPSPHRAALNLMSRILTLIITTCTNLITAQIGDQVERTKCDQSRPFLCPADRAGVAECIPLEYLCDGSPDCPAQLDTPAGFDEDPAVCKAIGRRPPSDESQSLLRILLTDQDADQDTTRKLPRM